MMASFLGSRPSLSVMLCHRAAQCVNVQARKPVQNLHTVSQWKRVLHTMQHRILKEQSTTTVSFGKQPPGTFCDIGYKQSGGSLVLPLFRQGNNMVYVRFMSSSGQKDTSKIDFALYVLSVIILFVGFGYAGVPLFKIFCRQYGIGGDPLISKGHDKTKVATMEKIDDREITVHFSANKNSAMQWNFQPMQAKMKVKLGETALAFYKAENPTEKPIIGIATYAVTPYPAAPYFNKIQCFCFEEQILNPHEKVDMPVFFYIDPEYDEDFELEFEDNIHLTYIFFEAKEGMDIPLPGFLRKNSLNAS